MENEVRVLVIRFSSIGDIVLTTPVVRCLKNQLEGDVKIHYLTKRAYQSLLSSNPYIDEIHTIDKSTAEVIEDLKKIEFDFVIDLHKNIRSFQVKRKLKAFSFTFNKYNYEKWLLVNFGINKMPELHLVERYFEAVSALSIENDNKGLDYFIPATDEVDINQAGLPHNFIALVIGGKFGGKKLPIKKLIELCRGLEHPLVLMGGKEDEEAAEAIESNLEKTIVNTCGKYSINQSASILSKARLVITHDTGLMHIAAAFKKDIISIWGATVPAFGMYPYLPGKNSSIIQAEHLTYRPTSKLGNRNTKRELRTMEEIDIPLVIQRANEIMSLSTPG